MFNLALEPLADFICTVVLAPMLVASCETLPELEKDVWADAGVATASSASRIILFIVIPCVIGAPTRDRTADLLITNQLLYR